MSRRLLVEEIGRGLVHHSGKGQPQNLKVGDILTCIPIFQREVAEYDSKFPFLHPHRGHLGVWVFCEAFRPVDRLIDWVSDSVIDWLIDWLIEWLIEWLIDWLIDWVSDRLIDWMIDRLIDWFEGWCTPPIGPYDYRFTVWFGKEGIDWFDFCLSWLFRLSGADRKQETVQILRQKCEKMLNIIKTFVQCCDRFNAILIFPITWTALDVHRKNFIDKHHIHTIKCKWTEVLH